ncbi:hypothetical protein GCM10011575_07150 [Microlunatus endophyticus]|uniref:Uncharacterized protein n=1 Tax=Microlunatus endophyticus TaxID=1716077 RepID=A0A917S2T3_9ACTN|nr:hypothetical protein GCM10011575_07150 [Microlunatus endophyticus]
MVAHQPDVTLRSRAERPTVAPIRLRRALEYARRYHRLSVNLRHQHLVLPDSRARAADPANHTHFLINFPGSPSGVDELTAWLPMLHRLSRWAPVAILVGDVLAYRAVSAETALPCYFGRVASEAEYVAQQLQTKVMLYVNQSKLNLREAGFHDILHVFLGAPGPGRQNWLNNRLRLYDYVLAPDDESKAWLAARMMAYDVSTTVRIVGRPVPPAGPLSGLGARLRAADVAEAGVDVDAVVEELLQIRDERDRLVTERDARLAEQGIVLLKGGQA